MRYEVAGRNREGNKSVSGARDGSGGQRYARGTFVKEISMTSSYRVSRGKEDQRDARARVHGPFRTLFKCGSFRAEDRSAIPLDATRRDESVTGPKSEGLTGYGFGLSR